MTTSVEQDCTFCDVMPDPQSAFDVNQSIDSTGVSIMPTIGMMLPGYLLAVTDAHMTSFAQMNNGELTKVDDALTVIEDELTPLFGGYFRLESGSDNVRLSCGSGGCIDHAHQHLVPATDVGAYILDKLPWKQLDAYEELAAYRGRPYIYLGMAGLHNVVAEPGLPGQWMRQQLATVRDLPVWDWALDPGRENLLETFAKVKETKLGHLATVGLNLAAHADN